MSGSDWESVAGAVPVILWILFLALRKRVERRNSEDEAEEQAPPTPHSPTQRRTRRRHDETGGFERQYDPIEPSWH